MVDQGQLGSLAPSDEHISRPRAYQVKSRVEKPDLRKAPGNLKSEQRGVSKEQDRRDKDMWGEEQGTFCRKQMASPHPTTLPMASYPHWSKECNPLNLVPNRQKKG